MHVPVLLEPIATGFRASTGAPLNLVAEAPTADEALAAVRYLFLTKQVAGARVVALSLPEPDPLIALADSMSKNPALEEWTEATREYRRQREAEEDAAERAAEANRTRQSPVPQQEPAA